MGEISWCSLQNMGLTPNRLRKEGSLKLSPRQRVPEVVAPDLGIVMIITETETIEGEAVVEAGEGMIVRSTARGTEIEIIVAEAEAAV